MMICQIVKIICVLDLLYFSTNQHAINLVKMFAASVSHLTVYWI